MGPKNVVPNATFCFSHGSWGRQEEEQASSTRRFTPASSKRPSTTPITPRLLGSTSYANPSAERSVSS